MVDYLEELLDNAGALLEQVRRMERQLSGVTAEERELSGVAAEEQENGGSQLADEAVSWKGNEVYNLKNQVDRQKKWVDESDFQGKDGNNEEETIVNQDKYTGDKPETSRGMREPSEMEKQPETRPALAAQLERLERAAAISLRTEQASGRAGNGGSGYPRSLTAPETARSFEPSVEVPGEGWSGGQLGGRSLPGGGTLWAEQADRAFRRDSRRYDGGFYLY